MATQTFFSRLDLSRRRLALFGCVAIAASMVIAAVVATNKPPATETPPLDAQLARSLPRLNAAPGFVTSAQCRECHPDEHASWHASFHRQMAQIARPETVLGPFDGTVVRYAGQVHRVVRKGDELWVESSPDDAGIDGQSGAAATVTSRRVVMTTGAHHMQIYWAADGKGNRLQELPVFYFRDKRSGKSRWAPLEASYISQTPADYESDTHWNTSCILCHATGGVPGLESDGGTRTTVAELGICCESCHGPAQEHVRLERRLADEGRDGSAADRQAIVNPARLRPERAAQVCGHCHAAAMFVSERLTEDFLLSGSAYRPGDDLLQTRVALLPARLSADANEANQQYNVGYQGSFWPDGMIRVTGREYNGLVESVCYQKGGMTCLSCHSMHKSDPDDQLSTAGRGDQACYQCHESYRDNPAAHTHHAANSSGSQCYNCHMPHTTYGLFNAIRSHKITSPDVASALATGRPTACNLCHLDQTLDWTDDKLSRWYGQPRHELPSDRRLRSEAATLLLKGDAAQRVLFAWAAGWKPALGASGADWLPPLLAPLLADPSPVIRLVTSRSLAEIGPRYDIDYDYAGPVENRRAAVDRIRAAWSDLPPNTRRSFTRRVFVKDGAADDKAINQRLRERDDRGLLIVE